MGALAAAPLRECPAPRAAVLTSSFRLRAPLRDSVVRPTLWIPSVVTGLLIGAGGTSLIAQSTVTVPDAITCDSCSIDVSVVVELGDVSGPGIVTDYALVGRSDDDGDYYVPFPPEGRLLRFSPDGTFRTAIGRTGEGPGEYRYPVLLRASGDTLRILDARAARITTISGDEITTSMLPFVPADWALLTDGRYVYSALSYESDRIGHPLHLVDEASARITRSFGGEGVRVDRSYQSRLALERRIAPAADGNVWAARVNRYRIDKWSPEGVHILRIERDAPWFSPWARSPGLPREVEPLPSIVGVRDLGDDLVMVIVSVADENWRPMPPARVVGGNHTVTSSAQREHLYDTLIEVVDTRSGTVLARTQVDANAIGLIGSDGFYSYAEHSGGEPRFVVWSVALSRTPR